MKWSMDDNYRFMVGNDEIDVEYPPLEVISLNVYSIPLKEYLDMAFDISRTCGIEMHFNENDHRYRLDFFLCKSVIAGKPLDDWNKLMGGSDLVCMSVSSDRARTIRVSFYRDKG